MNFKSLIPVSLRQAFRRAERHAANVFDKRPYAQKRVLEGGGTIASRKSLVMKPVPPEWETAQRNKSVTLRIASARVDGTAVGPGEYFSFWRAVGKPSRAKGYLPGMEVRGGKLIEAVGGGICQLSNALCWVFLQAGFEIVERHRHGWDLFPDDGRDVPFGSGATVLYPYKDLIVRNPWDFPVGIRAGLAGGDLSVELFSASRPPFRIELAERNHRFYREGGETFRANELWRLEYDGDKLVSEEMLFSNTAKVTYETGV